MINLAIAILNLRTGVCNNIIPFDVRIDCIIVILISTNSWNVERQEKEDIDPGTRLTTPIIISNNSIF